MSDARPTPLADRRGHLGCRPFAPLALVVAALTVVGVGCRGAEGRPAAHPDFRALQVGEARVAELASVAEDEGRICDERLLAVRRCDEEVQRVASELAGVRDADADARLARLRHQCAAARASGAGRCGPAA